MATVPDTKAFILPREKKKKSKTLWFLVCYSTVNSVAQRTQSTKKMSILNPLISIISYLISILNSVYSVFLYWKYIYIVSTTQLSSEAEFRILKSD